MGMIYSRKALCKSKVIIIGTNIDAINSNASDIGYEIAKGVFMYLNSDKIEIIKNWLKKKNHVTYIISFFCNFPFNEWKHNES